ncbi:MAG: hypothetical protein Q9176_002106 [Flavoplaca citrina]
MPSPPPTTTPSSTPCPFCKITSQTPPLPPPYIPSPDSPPSTSTPSDTNTNASAHILLSTPHLLAFLDHAPISRGHVLLVIRRHVEKASAMSVDEGQALGAWLGIVGRGVVRGVMGADDDDDEDEIGDWNIVQNNGARAAQVVPHVHFHIIPRTDDVPEVKARSWTVFGKGQREDLDEDEAKVLLGRIRRSLRREVERVRVEEGEGALKLLLGEGKGGWKL